MMMSRFQLIAIDVRKWLITALLGFCLVLFGPLCFSQMIFEDGFEDNDLPMIPASDQPTSARQSARPLGSTDAIQGFYEYLPAGYSEQQQYPLLIFVHGLGENGNGVADLPRVLSNGPPRLIDRDQWDAQLPFVVLSAQHSGGGCTSSAEIKSLIDFALVEYSVNPERVYLTGLSCGGIGSWNYASNHLTSQIAAMVPIAGDGRGGFNRAGCALGQLPIWAFHGDSDGVVPYNGSRVPIDGLRACNPAPVDSRLTTYAGVGHNSWSRTYNLSAGNDIYQWMLSYRRPPVVR